MRRVRYALCTVGLTVVGGTAALSGCVFNTPIDCENALVNCSLTGDGGGGGTPAECVPSLHDKPVDGMCGVFVSSTKGQDSNMGTKISPFQTLQHAVEQAMGRPVYACAEEFTGSVTLAKGSAIYGGLDCNGAWAYVGAMKKSALTGEADKVALTLASTAKGAEVVDFTVQAANAMVAGGSSIAVVADQVEARLTRCDLVAGDGVAGADGDDAPSVAATKGADGSKGGNACSADTVLGGTLVENQCGLESSIGGNGGNGNKASGTDGSSGAPSVASKGAGGKGETFVGWDCSADGSNGGAGVGAAGQAGTEGAGATMRDLGQLSSSGFTGAAGGDGEPGKIGQGGGGGGGAKGGVTECSGKPTGGASGGSGGAGGCGGAGGKGGQGGGASIALVSLQASLTLEKVTLKVGNGGKGGAGGDLQLGGLPGTGGAGGSSNGTTLKAGCKGGDGGPGGNGGPGGGGRGGHAIGLAYTGMAPAIDMEQITPGTAGKGGDGGNNNVKPNAGTEGSAVPVQSFE